MSVAREGWPLIVPPAVVGAGLVLIGWHWAGAFFLLIALAVAMFFRDPQRAPSAFSGSVVSPADGRIVSVTESDEPDYLKTPSRRISVFMSLFNVHVNYAPVPGTVARRIVCRLKVGNPVQCGEKIGLIKFGSRVDVFVPLEWEVFVKEGERVRGGITQLARIE
jgi:phosphatidylserine decarboxylase